MKSIKRLTAALLVFVISFVFLRLQFSALLIDINESNAALHATLIALGIGILLGTLAYKRSKKTIHVICSTGIGWFLGVLTGIVYVFSFNINGAQSIILPVIWTGPTGLILGFFWSNILSKVPTRLNENFS